MGKVTITYKEEYYLLFWVKKHITHNVIGVAYGPYSAKHLAEGKGNHEREVYSEHNTAFQIYSKPGITRVEADKEAKRQAKLNTLALNKLSRDTTGKTEIFVFGSNLKGIHGNGAAKTARFQYGAEPGVGVGRTGNAYAIPTKKVPTWDKRQFKLEEIEAHVKVFIEYAKEHPELIFKVTRIGCGLAGYKDSEISIMFSGHSENVVLPEEWK